MDVLGDCCATLINHGHPRSEVAKYSVSTLFFLLNNLAKVKYGAEEKPSEKAYSSYPIERRSDHGAKGHTIRIQGGASDRESFLDG
jgi:hypothetical protein